VPIVAVCGTLGISRQQALKAGFADVHSLTDIERDPAACMTNVGPLLERTAEIVAADRHPGPAADPSLPSLITAD
jgi:glycerate kinase